MSVKGKPFYWLLIVWILVVPAGFFYLLSTQPIPELHFLWMAGSIVFGFLSIRFPIMYNGKPIVLFVWFTLPIFLLYGLTAELIVTQLIVFFAGLHKLRDGENAFRLVYNSIAYFLISVLSAAAFYATGTQPGELSFGALAVSAAVYQVVYAFLYDGTFKLCSKLTGCVQTVHWKETIYQYIFAMVVVPLALTLYYLLVYYGSIGFLLVAVPFFCITLLLRVNTERDDLNRFLQSGSYIGQRLTKLTNEPALVEEFMTQTTKLFNADYTYLYGHYDGWLEPTHFYAHGKKAALPEVRLTGGQGIAGKLLSDRQSFLCARREEWFHRTVTSVPDDLESLLCIPLIRHQKFIGAFVIGSRKKDHFREFHLNVLDLLSSYFIVSAENAQYIEEAELESTRCALTGLYNYRYLERQLEQETAIVNRRSDASVSVVMLDIDYFKKVNDTYGHASGNLILKQLAALLEEACPEGGTLARYGGEEFVYVLPGYAKQAAYNFAEMLRRAIEETPMEIENDLGSADVRQFITITVSIGVSSAPEDTDEAVTLLRNADRSLYIGAKQAGRNRVSAYTK